MNITIQLMHTGRTFYDPTRQFTMTKRISFPVLLLNNGILYAETMRERHNIEMYKIDNNGEKVIIKSAEYIAI